MADGHAVLSPQLAGVRTRRFLVDIGVRIDPELDQLTKREREVLQHLARAYTYRGIADASSSR